MTRALAAAALAAAYAALAGLVAAGSLTGVDQWAIDHAMPGGHGGGSAPTLAEALVPLLHANFDSALSLAADVVTLPASVLPSLLIVAGCCAVLGRRGRIGAALAWAGAWVLGNAIEVTCKHVLVRPPLHRGVLHVIAFDSSYPSGHTLRTVLVAATLAATWPRLRVPVSLWAACSIGLLEPAGYHTPSDIVGGLLLAALLLLAAHAAAPLLQTLAASRRWSGSS